MNRTQRALLALISVVGVWASPACTEPSVGEEVVSSAARSVVQVNAASSPEDPGDQGSGWVAAPDRVVTAAHVVASQTVVWVRDKGPWPGRLARVVGFDPARDIAVLHVPDLGIKPLALADAAQPETPAVLLARGLGDASPAAREETVTRTADRTVAGICPNSHVSRNVVEFSGPIYLGDSGGPLVDPAGHVLAVATSNLDESTNYGTSADAVRQVLDRAGTTPVATDPRC